MQALLPRHQCHPRPHRPYRPPPSLQPQAHPQSHRQYKGMPPVFNHRQYKGIPPFFNHRLTLL